MKTQANRVSLLQLYMHGSSLCFLEVKHIKLESQNDALYYNYVGGTGKLRQ